VAGFVEVAPRTGDALPAPMFPLLAFDEFEYLSFITT